MYSLEPNLQTTDAVSTPCWSQCHQWLLRRRFDLRIGRLEQTQQMNPALGLGRLLNLVGVWNHALLEQQLRYADVLCLSNEAAEK